MAAQRSSRLSAGSAIDSAKSLLPNGSVAVTKKRKTVAGSKADVVDKDGFAVPSTPKRKRVTKAVEPSTPTPAAAKLMGLPRSSGDADGHISPVNRVADPHITNAPLISPQTSRVIAHKPTAAAPPSKPLQSRTTTGNILEKACTHLIETDPRMKPLVAKHHCAIFSPEGLAEEIDPFKSLTSGIISQQVSGAAAKSIKNKFVALFNPELSSGNEDNEHVFPSPSQVAVADLATLRTAGLSQRKAEYIKGLAEKFASGELTTEMLLEAEYEEVLEKLIAVRGLGKWSVEMFACFSLKRMDVFSTGDLGVQRGMAAFVGKDVSKLKGKGGGKWKYMSEKDMLDISEKFSPYRSVFMWYMWRVEDVDVSTLET